MTKNQLYTEDEKKKSPTLSYSSLEMDHTKKISCCIDHLQTHQRIHQGQNQDLQGQNQGLRGRNQGLQGQNQVLQGQGPNPQDHLVHQVPSQCSTLWNWSRYHTHEEEEPERYFRVWIQYDICVRKPKDLEFFSAYKE